jgi:hypothetical protein
MTQPTPSSVTTDPRDVFIAQVVRGKSFADVGGLWGTVNEKVSVAHAAGARSLTMIDRVFPSEPWWPAFEDRCRSLGVGEVRHISGDIISVAEAAQHPVFDVVHCGGVLYHAPDPIRLLQALRRITGEYLILGTLVTSTRVVTELGTVSVPESAGLFIPALQRREREILETYWRRFIGDGAGGLTSPTVWDPGNYEPWWWLHTVPAVRAMCEVAGFTYLNTSPYWHDNACAMLLTTRTQVRHGT